MDATVDTVGLDAVGLSTDTVEVSTEEKENFELEKNKFTREIKDSDFKKSTTSEENIFSKNTYDKNAENLTVKSISNKHTKNTSDNSDNYIANNYNISENYVATETDLPVSLVADLDKNLDNSLAEFGYLISRFLVIIHSVLEANTVAFIWVNNENKTLLFDSYLSGNNVKDSIITDKRMKFGSDVISQIVANSKPQILSQINPAAELDLIPYYVEPVGTTSFIGIPIIFENAVVGILCADSAIQDIYNRTTVIFLGHFTKILSALFGSYSNNYSNENANKTLELLNKFSGIASLKNCTFSQICSALIDFVVELYDCSSAGICYYNDSFEAWTVCSYKSIRNIDENFFKAAISLDNSLIGMSILNCKLISLASVPHGYVRVNQFEHQYDNISFISIPIKSTTDTYGALFIEANDNGFLNSTVDFEILRAICNQAGEILEKIQLVKLFNNFVSTEIKTGIFSENAFRSKITAEVSRSNETKQSVSLALFALDKSASSDDANKKAKVFDSVINAINQQLKSFEFVGRVNNDVIGIILINRDQVQAKLLLERIRQQIATQFIDFFDERLVVTVSIGMAAIRPNDTFETFTSNATIALYQAQRRSNCVQIFE